MATAKKVSVAAVKKSVAATKVVTAKPAAVLKPIKTAFNKTSLIAHLAEQAGLEPKAAKAFMAALEATVLASVHKKGLGEFTLPGLMKITGDSGRREKEATGHRSVHEGREDVRGQACDDQNQGACVEEAERRRALDQYRCFWSE